MKIDQIHEFRPVQKKSSSVIAAQIQFHDFWIRRLWMKPRMTLYDSKALQVCVFFPVFVFSQLFAGKRCGHIVPKLGPAASPACGVNPKGEARGTGTSGTPTPAWPVPGLPSICVQSSLSKPSSAKSWIFTPINIAFRKYSHHGKPKGHATKDGFVPLYWRVKCCSLVNCFAKVLQRLKVSKMLNSWSLVAETHSAW